MARNPKYKYCMVPKCTSSSFSMDKKLFISVPKGEHTRKLWCKAMNRNEVSAKSTLYVCEDHFDLEKDMANYMRHKFQGGKIILKPGVIPHKFDCPKSPTKGSPSPLKRGSRYKKKTSGSSTMESQPSTSAGATMPQPNEPEPSSSAASSRASDPEVIIKQEIIEIQDDPPAPPAPTCSAGDEVWVANFNARAIESYALELQSSVNPNAPCPLHPNTTTIIGPNGSRTCSVTERIPLGPYIRADASTSEDRRNVTEPSAKPATANEPRDRDEYDFFGMYIAAKLRKLDKVNSAYAQKAIGDIIFNAEMGHLRK